MKKRRLLCLLSVLLCVSLSACAYKIETKELAAGKVGVEYSDTIAGKGKDIYYELAADSAELPLGMLLYDDGTIEGIPEEAGAFHFSAVAVDLKDRETRADFTIVIAKGELSYAAKPLDDAEAGKPYIVNVANATGINGIRYAAKDNAPLPEGLSISAEGEISGIPAAEGDYTFTIVASANGCDDVEAEFQLHVEPGEPAMPTDLGKIVFEDFTLPVGYVGEEYNETVQYAYGVPDITYKVKYVGGKGLPKGLKFNDLGMIAGVPQDSTSGTLKFTVTASAEGYKSVKVNCYLTVLDQYVATNRFEAEHIDVTGLKGAGYSGSASELAMIQKYPNASNGRSLGYLNCALQFSFNFTSELDTTAKLTLGLGSEMWGDLTLTTDSFKVLVNGEEVAYDPFTVLEIGSGQDREFRPYTLSPVVNLKAGDNTITIQILDSVATAGIGTATAQGPMVDYLQIEEANGEIGWRPRVANTK